eukprot:Gregarina_sp_Poly_1__1896@NODE_1495_length_4002_cov_84_516900_g991_i0_p1_GENE_NODE_1495_length_4002_cov_84_516900_g991_i0NODE_1495_length_4002_cov_84_516900_g991_i0_p1_ORF_typecomplete_len931_score193_48HSP70/PF00012_20/1_9e86MreB_Mbl/PF06723_13/2e23StbA/PF06406_11/8e06FtsA/PF14450_6/3_5e03FtsA/PF14450_6/5_6e07Actin/PF00022_19/1_6e06PilM_2/PF11104_8/0_00029Hydantoinase_A/PF01968_18/2_3e03Hydantoinase_A/PF01968_18/0_054Hydantoinase_A/PF01968_18/5_3e02DDR/PF08841_10/0_57DDR/PF08841_10/6_9e02GUCT/P
MGGSNGEKKIVIGIDLGTTTSCAARILPKGDIIEVFDTAEGKKMIPSAVLFQGGAFTGQVTLDEQRNNPKQTVFQVKRIMGRDFDSEAVRKISGMDLYKIVEGPNKKPLIEIPDKDGIQTFTPEQISAFILEDIMRYCEAKTEAEISGVVITVPAYFNNAQRDATKLAAEIAQLPLLQLLNEPIAAAFSFMKRADETNRSIDGRKFLVFDFGGGTCDVSVLEVQRYALSTLAVAGNMNLGGSDITEKLVDLAIEQFRIQQKVDVAADPDFRVFIRSSAESAKRRLSRLTRTNIYGRGRTKGGISEFCIEITRKKLEEVCSDIFDKCLELIHSALELAGLEAKDINIIVLAGGSSRIPKLQEKIKAIFPGGQIDQTDNCDEAVVKGAAIYANCLISGRTPILFGKAIRNILPFSLGTAVKDGKMSVIIPKNSAVPVEKTKQYQTVMDNQECMTIDVWEGESKTVAENCKLGDFEMKLPPGPTGSVVVEVTFRIDKNGMFNVSAIDNITKEKIEMYVVGGYEQDLDTLINKNGKYNAQNRRLQALKKAEAALKKAKAAYVKFLDTELTLLKDLGKRQNLFQIQNCLEVESLCNLCNKEQKWCNELGTDGNASEVDTRRDQFQQQAQQAWNVFQRGMKNAEELSGLVKTIKEHPWTEKTDKLAQLLNELKSKEANKKWSMADITKYSTQLNSAWKVAKEARQKEISLYQGALDEAIYQGNICGIKTLLSLPELLAAQRLLKNESAISALTINEIQSKRQLLAEAIKQAEIGWPQRVALDKELKQFFDRMSEVMLRYPQFLQEFNKLHSKVKNPCFKLEELTTEFDRLSREFDSLQQFSAALAKLDALIEEVKCQNFCNSELTQLIIRAQMPHLRTELSKVENSYEKILKKKQELNKKQELEESAKSAKSKPRLPSSPGRFHYTPDMMCRLWAK